MTGGERAAAEAASGPATDRPRVWLRRGLGGTTHWILLALTLAGVAIAGYLTWVHYAGLEPLCAGSGGGCERVQSSSYAELAGVPVAVLGLAGYIAILGSLLVRGEAARLGTAALSLAGMGFSAYLTYLELFVIDAICQWCVTSAVLMTAIAALSVFRVMDA